MSKEMLEKLVQVATIIQAVAIPIAIGIAWFQWDQQNKIARASNAQTLAAQAADFNYKLLDSDDNLRIWYGMGKVQAQKPSDSVRYRELLVQWLIFHENAYFQHKSGLLDDELYRSWDVDLRYTIKNHNLSVVGLPLDELFPTQFGRYIKSLQRSQ